MSEKTLKLSDGRDVSYTGTVREIVKSCHDMALKGMAVTVSTLKIVNPKHSNRDYTAAIEIYQDEIRTMRNCSSPMPPSVRDLCNESIALMWGIVNRHHKDLLDGLQATYKKEADDARAAQSIAIQANNDLTAEIEELNSKLASLRADVESLETVKANMATDLIKQQAETDKYRQMYEGLKACLANLTEHCGQSGKCALAADVVPAVSESASAQEKPQEIEAA